MMAEQILWLQRLCQAIYFSILAVWKIPQLAAAEYCVYPERITFLSEDIVVCSDCVHLIEYREQLLYIDNTPMATVYRRQKRIWSYA